MRDSMTDNDGLHEYTYDLIYQIIEATHPTVSNPMEEFDYDSVGNRVGGMLTHNELNQLLEDDSCYYEYDNDGNMTVKVDKTTNDTTKFTWDIENRLIRVEKSGTVAEYVYGPLGRRLRKTVNAVSKELRYDGEDLIIEMNENDSILASFTFGPGIDQPFMMNRNNNNYYYLSDGLGSITAITDETGNVLQEYKYSVFGKIMEQTADSIENYFTFTAREWEPEIGLYYYRNRFYDPRIGRFISEDPIGFDACEVNFYSYVENQPTILRDPYGLEPIGPIFGEGGLQKPIDPTPNSHEPLSKPGHYRSDLYRHYKVSKVLSKLLGSKLTMKIGRLWEYYEYYLLGQQIDLTDIEADSLGAYGEEFPEEWLDSKKPQFVTPKDLKEQKEKEDPCK